MTLVATVARNTVWAFGGQIATRLIQLGASMVLARTLETSGFGDFGYLVAVLTFFQFLGDLGVEKISLREIARDPTGADRLVGATMGLRAVLSIGAAAIAAAFLYAAAPSPRLARLGALACLSLPFNLASIYPAYYQAVLRVKKGAWISVVQGAIGSGFLLAGALLPSLLPSIEERRLEAVVIAFALAPLATLGVSAWLARGDLRPGIRGGRAVWGRLLREGAPLAFNTICLLASLRADQVILRSVKGAAPLGQYVAALRLLDAFSVVPTVLLVSAFPLMARFDRVAPERFIETTRYTCKLLATIVLPVALAVSLLAEPILGTLFGEPYVPAAPTLAILVWSLFFAFSGMVISDAITAAGRQAIFLGLSVFTTAVNIGLNLLLIPRYGARGAAIAFLVYSASSLPVLVALRKTRPLMRALLDATWRPVLVTATLALAVQAGVPRALFIGGLLPVYGLLLLATGAIDRTDLALLRRALRRSP